MNGEGLFNAYAVRNTSNCEGLGDSAAVLCDNGSLEELNSLSCTLDDFVVNANCVTALIRSILAPPYYPDVRAEQWQRTILIYMQNRITQIIISYYFPFCNSFFEFFADFYKNNWIIRLFFLRGGRKHCQARFLQRRAELSYL